jgi:hypothetical protein
MLAYKSSTIEFDLHPSLIYKFPTLSNSVIRIVNCRRALTSQREQPFTRRAKSTHGKQRERGERTRAIVIAEDHAKEENT